MKMRHLTALLLFPFLTSCLRLDDNLFNPEEKITAYGFDQYKGVRELPDLPDSISVEPNRQQFFFLSSGPEKIACIYLGDSSEIPDKEVILYCHGNKNHMDNYWNRAKLLYHTGGKGKRGVLMMDYRGYGLSTGKPSEQGLYDDVAACINWLRSKGLKENNLIVYGYSLGSAPATYWSQDPGLMPVKKLILEAPYCSADQMVKDASKLQLPGSYFTNLNINNGERIRQVKAPFLWIHGKNDDFLDAESQGRTIYNHYPDQNKKRLLLIPGAVHNDVPKVIGYTEYLKLVNDFIEWNP
jgi:pimeloyl-ACP methyl ester carboxylesterase